MPDVLAVIASVLQVDPESLAEDDGVETMPAWDSLKTLLIVSMLEITYDITLDNDDIEQLTTVRAARRIVDRHAGA